MVEGRLLATVLLCLTRQSLARHLGDERVDVDNTSTDGAENNELSNGVRPINITVNVHVTNGPNFTQLPELISDTVNRFFSHVQNGHLPWLHLELTSHEMASAPDNWSSTSSSGTPSPQSSSPPILRIASPGSSGWFGVRPSSSLKQHDSTSTPVPQSNLSSSPKMKPSGLSISTSSESSTTILPTSEAPQTDFSSNLPETTTQQEEEVTVQMAPGMFRG